MPTPRPDTCVTVAAVENPGAKMRSMSCRVAHRRERLRPRRRCAPSPPRERVATSIPPPSSVTSMRTCSPSRNARRRIVATAGLPAAARRGGILDAMVHRVAQHVHERLHEDFDDRLVRLGVFALDHQRRGLAELRRRSRVSGAGNRWKATRSGSTRMPTTARCSSPTRRSRPACWFLSVTASAEPSLSASLTAWPIAFFATVSSPVSRTSASIRSAVHAQRLRAAVAAACGGRLGCAAARSARPRATAV